MSAYSSLASSAMIMPASASASMCLPSSPLPVFPPVPDAYAHVAVAPPSSTVETDDAMSDTSSFVDVDDIVTTSESVAPTDAEREEFDFMDEEADEETADEL